MIHQTWSQDPGWPPEAGRTRSVIDGVVVDWSGTQPAPADVRAQHLAVTPSLAEVARRIAAVSMTSTDAPSVRMRAEARTLFALLVNIIQAGNATCNWTRLMKAAVAAANNFADLKTRIAGLPTLVDQDIPTRAAVKDEVLAKINSDDPNG